MNIKICKKCGQILPINNSYFPPDKGCKDGFRNVCKICSGESKQYGIIKNPSFKWNKGLEDKLIELYFENTYEWICENVDEFKALNKKSLSDKMNTLRKKYPEKHLYKNDKTINLEQTFWSDAQVDFIIQNYSNYTNEELLGFEILSNLTIEKISNKVSRLNMEKGFGLAKSEETRKRAYEQAGNKTFGVKRILSDSHLENIRASLKTRRVGLWSGKNNPKYGTSLVGKENPNWKGGKTPLYSHLRKCISNWKSKSMAKYNYKCFITSKNFDVIHHLEPFKEIVDECLSKYKMVEYGNIENYSPEFLAQIEKEIVEAHEKYGLGVCLANEVHIEFHDIYGYCNCTKENFIEFCKDIYGINWE